MCGVAVDQGGTNPIAGLARDRVRGHRRRDGVHLGGGAGGEQGQFGAAVAGEVAGPGEGIDHVGSPFDRFPASWPGSGSAGSSPETRKMLRGETTAVTSWSAMRQLLLWEVGEVIGPGTA